MTIRFSTYSTIYSMTRLTITFADHDIAKLYVPRVHVISSQLRLFYIIKYNYNIKYIINVIIISK